MRASIHGWNDYLQNPDATNAHLLTLNPALNAAQVAYTVQTLKEGAFITGSGAQIGHMNADRWQASYSQLKSLGIVSSSVDPSAAYSLDFVRR